MPPSQRLRPVLCLARPVFLVNLVIRRIIPIVMLLGKVAVMLVDIALLLVGQLLAGVGSGDAEVGDLGLGRRVARGRGQGLAIAGASLGAVGESVRAALRFGVLWGFGRTEGRGVERPGGGGGGGGA